MIHVEQENICSVKNLHFHVIKAN